MKPNATSQSPSNSSARALVWHEAAREWLTRAGRPSGTTTRAAGDDLHTTAQDAPHHIMRREELFHGLSTGLIAQPVQHLPDALRVFDASYAHHRPAPGAQNHAIVVLGVPVREGDGPNPHLAARVHRAHELAQLHHQAPLIVTGAHVQHPSVAHPAPGSIVSTQVEAHAMREMLVGLGVSPSRIIAEPHAEHTVGNLAYSYQKIEAELMPVWGTVAHLTVCMEPYHAVRALRIAAALIASRMPTARLHMALAARLDAKLRRLSSREHKLVERNLIGVQGLANLNRCVKEKWLLAEGW
jgi:uncharacterized SAM-binding protein YcdF (DUF218 family)